VMHGLDKSHSSKKKKNDESVTLLHVYATCDKDSELIKAKVRGVRVRVRGVRVRVRATGERGHHQEWMQRTEKQWRGNSIL
jgi:hypothetical protein